MQYFQILTSDLRKKLRALNFIDSTRKIVAEGKTSISFLTQRVECL
jgi:hypothetical protein